MLSWYRSQVKDHGLLPATRLLSRVVRYRIPVVLKNKLLPAKIECPCCGWKGSRFFDFIDTGYRVPNAACPRCDSHPRHRGLYLWLKNEFELEKLSGRVLVFAPERALASLWKSARDLRVTRIDIEPSRGVDLLADITKLPFVGEFVKLIWCHHVLEQVDDDRAAIGELYRVLLADGELVISAGLSGKKKTEEFGGPHQLLSGSRRRYGDDFSERLEEAGFQVTSLTYNLTAEQLERYAIFPETFFRCRKLR